MPRQNPQAPRLSNINHTYHVTSLADGPEVTTDCPGPNCTLRDAIGKANNDGHAAADLILVRKGTITLTDGYLAPYTNMFIMGKGSSKSGISGGNSSEIFYLYDNGSVVPYPSVEIDRFTLRNGSGTDGGAAQRENSVVTLDHDVLRKNAASRDGAAVTQ